MDTMRYSAIAMLMVAAVGGGAAAGVMRLYGRGFEPAAPALAILLLLPGLQTLSAVQSQLFYAVNRPVLTSVTAAVRAVIGVGATVAGVELLGLTGAAIGLVTGVVVDVVMKLMLARSTLSAPLRALWPLHQLAALGAAYLASFEVAHLLVAKLPSPVGVLIAIPTAVPVYGLALYCARGLAHRDFERMGKAVRQLRKRAGRRVVGVP